MLAAVFSAAEPIEPPENSRAMVIGIAAVMIAESLKPGDEIGVDELNAIWAAQALPWQLTRVH